MKITKQRTKLLVTNREREVGKGMIEGIKRYKLLCINTIKWNMLQAVEYSFILDKTI